MNKLKNIALSTLLSMGAVSWVFITLILLIRITVESVRLYYMYVPHTLGEFLCSRTGCDRSLILTTQILASLSSYKYFYTWFGVPIIPHLWVITTSIPFFLYSLFMTGFFLITSSIYIVYINMENILLLIGSLLIGIYVGLLSHKVYEELDNLKEKQE